MPNGVTDTMSLARHKGSEGANSFAKALCQIQMFLRTAPFANEFAPTWSFISTQAIAGFFEQLFINPDGLLENAFIRRCKDHLMLIGAKIALMPRHFG